MSNIDNNDDDKTLSDSHTETKQTWRNDKKGYGLKHRAVTTSKDHETT